MEFEHVVKILQTEWFDRFQVNGQVQLSYLGYIAQGPLREEPFPVEDIIYPIACRSPLYDVDLKPYQRVWAKL